MALAHRLFPFEVYNVIEHETERPISASRSLEIHNGVPGVWVVCIANEPTLTGIFANPDVSLLQAKLHIPVTRLNVPRFSVNPYQ
jgi:hypothetical protein